MFERKSGKQQRSEAETPKPVYDPVMSDKAVEELAAVVAADESGQETQRHQYKRTHPNWTCQACGRVETDPREIGTRGCRG